MVSESIERLRRLIAAWESDPKHDDPDARSLCIVAALLADRDHQADEVERLTRERDDLKSKLTNFGGRMTELRTRAEVAEGRAEAGREAAERERDDARRGVCKATAFLEFEKTERFAALARGWGYLYPEEPSERCPACGTPLRNATGIGPYCPEEACPRLDDLRKETSE